MFLEAGKSGAVQCVLTKVQQQQEATLISGAEAMGLFLGRGRQIKKFQASTFEDSGEEGIEAWDHTGLVSGFEGPRVKCTGILGSLVWQGGPLLKAHHWYLDLVGFGHKP